MISPEVRKRQASAFQPKRASSPRRRPAPLPPPVHPIMIHRCDGCATRQATYQGEAPREWARVSGLYLCKRCRFRRD